MSCLSAQDCLMRFLYDLIDEQKRKDQSRQILPAAQQPELAAYCHHPGTLCRVLKVMEQKGYQAREELIVTDPQAFCKILYSKQAS
jgi:hypothetical protein